MNTRIKNLLVVCCAVVTLSFTIGCGELPENEKGVIEFGGSEQASSISELPDAIPDELVKIDQDSQFDSAIELEEQPSWLGGPLAAPSIEDRVDYVPDNGGDIETDDIIEELSFDPFTNGCAGGEEWQTFTERVCEKEGLGLEELIEEFSCPTGGHRMTQFACSDSTEHGMDSTPIKFKAFMLGGNGACKDMDTYWAHAERLCGPNSRLTMKEPLGSCDSAGETPSYSVVRFVCKTK